LLPNLARTRQWYVVPAVSVVLAGMVQLSAVAWVWPEPTRIELKLLAVETWT
jgi:hypothetical protein